jgi:branched-chain amino acid aminotransferase
MNEGKSIWMNGKNIPWEKGNVHFLSHALHYGTAVFEGIRCYNTENGAAIFRLEDHVERFFKSSETFGITVPYSKKQIKQAIIDTVKNNNLQECYIRPLVYYSEGGLGFDVTKQKVDVGIAAWAWGSMLGKESITKGISLKISPFKRPSSEFMPVTAKVSGNYANSIMAKMDAIKTGYDDAVMLDKYGFVAECSAENIFIVKDNKIMTPTKENCLDGITRATILELAPRIEINAEEKKISINELVLADEVFVCGTAAEIVPVTKIGEIKIGEGTRGPVTEKIQKESSCAVRGGKKSSWNTYV